MSVLNKLIVSLVALMTVAVGAVAANYSPDTNFRIYCTTISMPSDGVVTAPLLLDNPQGYGDMRRAFQVDVTLPAGYGFVATNGRYAAPSSGFTIHEHLFNESGVNKLRLVLKAEQTVVAATGREICSLTLKQIDRTLQQSSTIGFSNFIYVRAASTSGHYGAEQTVTLNPYVYATAVTLNKTSLEMYSKESSQLNTILVPSNSTASISWSSSDSSVAIVDDSGLVTAKGLGTAQVTATTVDGTNLSARCEVTVKGASGVTLSKTSLSLYAGETATLSATVSPSRASSQPVTWHSSNNDVVTVDENGVITAVGVGTSEVTATTTDGTNLSATCAVTVSGATSIKLDKTDVVLFNGDSVKLTATVQPSRTTAQALSWTSSSTSVATVDVEGNVIAKGLGSATITVATTDGTGLNATCSVNVTPDYMLLVDSLVHVRGTERVARAVNVNLANRNAISALQFDLSLPSYMTMAYSGGYPDIWLDENRKARNHSVDISKTSTSSQQYRVIVSSPTNRTFSGNGGAILHFNVLIDQYPGSTGNYQIGLSNIVLSEADETQHTISSVTGNVKYGYLVGDANADLHVDVSDYVLTANKILQRSVSNFWSDAANAAYVDNSINVTDLVAITNIALENRDKEIRPAPAVRDNAGEVSLAVGEQAVDGSNVTVPLSLSNDVAVAALQADVTLPDGMTVVAAHATGRAASMGVETATMPDGRMRLLLSQFGNGTIAAGEGEIVMLTLAGTPAGDAVATVDDIIVTGRDLTTHYPSALSLTLGELTGIVVPAMSQARVYVENGAIAIDSPVDCTAVLCTVDGRSRPLAVDAGHNVYRVDSHGVYIVWIDGHATKLAL